MGPSGVCNVASEANDCGDDARDLKRKTKAPHSLSGTARLLIPKELNPVSRGKSDERSVDGGPQNLWDGKMPLKNASHSRDLGSKPESEYCYRDWRFSELFAYNETKKKGKVP